VNEFGHSSKSLCYMNSAFSYVALCCVWRPIWRYPYMALCPGPGQRSGAVLLYTAVLLLLLLTYGFVLLLHGSDEGHGLRCARAHRLRAAVAEHAGHRGLVGETEPPLVLQRNGHVDTGRCVRVCVCVLFLLLLCYCVFSGHETYLFQATCFSVGIVSVGVG